MVSTVNLHITATSPTGPTGRHDFLTKCYPQKTVGREGKKMERKERRGGGANGFLHAVPSTSTQLACLLLNQTAWLVLVL